MKIRFWPHTSDPNIASYRIRCREISRGIMLAGSDAVVVSQPEPADVLVLSKRYDAESLTRAKNCRDQSGAKIALDICDNHFHNKSSSAYLERRQMDLKEALQAVDLVIASSKYLADELIYHAPSISNIRIIDDIIESPFYPKWNERLLHPLSEILLNRLEMSLLRFSSERHTRLVWFGNAGGGFVDGGMENLSRVRAHVEAISSLRPVTLTVISNSHQRFKEVCKGWKIPTFYLPWHRQTISRALVLHGISMIPIEQNPFTKAKTANRVTTSLAHGLVTLADDIPSYRKYANRIILDDWNSGLQLLTSDREAWSDRAKLGLQEKDIDCHNRRIVREWADALHNLA